MSDAVEPGPANRLAAGPEQLPRRR